MGVGETIVNKTDKRPDNFEVVYSWGAGSAPSPYYYQYTIHLYSDGAGELALTPDIPADNVQKLKWTFNVEKAKLDNLCQVMVENGILTEPWKTQQDPLPGAAVESLTVTIEDRKVEVPPYSISSQKKPFSVMCDAVKTVVPKDIWEMFSAKRNEYTEKYKSVGR